MSDTANANLADQSNESDHAESTPINRLSAETAKTPEIDETPETPSFHSGSKRLPLDERQRRWEAKHPDGRGGLLYNRNHTTALRNLEKAYGGREEMYDFLAIADNLTASENAFLQNLSEKTHAKRSVREVCKMTQFSLCDLFKLLGKAEKAEAFRIAHKIAYSNTPAVVQNLFERAQKSKVDCSACRGLGLIANSTGAYRSNIKCKACNGSGSIVQQPNLKRQQTALQLVGLIKNDKGNINVNQQVNLSANEPRASVEFWDATDRVLKESRARLPASNDTVDAEIASEKPGES